MNLPTRPLSDADRLDWLRLARTENVGPVTFFKLLNRYGTIAQAIEALPELARKGGRSAPLPVVSRGDAEREVESLTRFGGRLIAACEPDYPDLLAEIADPPPVISVKGDIRLFQKPAVGMVGARNASLNGQRLAEKLARELGEAGLLVVSGLARGIDTAAHKGSLASGTVAVVAGGIDVVYPHENRALFDQIAERGIVVAEAAFGTEPQARHFPRRNRTIAGLSRGIVVVEAALQSGSLITARLANEQGREVFAIPGSPLDARCRGTNNLIRQGATLTESADDVLEVLAPTLKAQGGLFEPPPPALQPVVTNEGDIDRARDIILQNLGPSPVPVDELVRGCQLSAPVVMTVLLELELAGRVQRQAGNHVALIAEL